MDYLVWDRYLAGPSYEDDIVDRAKERVIPHMQDMTRFEPLTPVKAHTPVGSAGGIAATHGAVKGAAKVLLLTMDVATVPELLKLAQVNRALRQAATAEQLWEPYLEEMGVSKKGTASASEHSTELVETLTAMSVLDAGFAGSAYSTILRVVKILGPYYNDPESIQDDFTSFADQARVVLQAQRLGCLDAQQPVVRLAKEARLQTHANNLKNAALIEIERKLNAKEFKDIYPAAQILIVLHDTESLVQLYLNYAVFREPAPLVDHEQDSETVEMVLKNGTVKGYLDTHLGYISEFLNAKGKEIDVIFDRLSVYEILLSKVLEDNVLKIVTDILEGAQARSEADYFDTVPIVFEALEQMIGRLQPCHNSGPEVQDLARQELYQTLTLHIEAFLERQGEAFHELAMEKVRVWSNQITTQEITKEDSLWSNVPRQQDKRNFLSSFKKVLVGSSASTQPSKESTPAAGPQTEFEAQTAVMESKLQGIQGLFSLELTLGLIDVARQFIRRDRAFSKLPGKLGDDARQSAEAMFVDLVEIIGSEHIVSGFLKALRTLQQYDPKRYGRLVKEQEREDGQLGVAVEPLAIFAELVNIGDLIQQTIHVFFEQELVAPKLVDRTDFVAPSVNAKRRFEQQLDKCVADGLSRGIDVLIDEIDFVLMTVQLGSDFCPLPGTVTDLGPTPAAKKVVSLVKSHVQMLVGSTEKTVLDVFQQEVGLRLYSSICKHIKRQTINMDGAVTLISDINFYYGFILTLRQRPLYDYYEALKQVAQLYLIDTADAKQLGMALNDMSRYKGVISTDELVEFAQRRQDWPLVKGKVEKVLYGFNECVIC